MKDKKDIIYIFFTIVFYIISMAMVCWIDRQKIDKEVEKRAEKICQENALKNKEEKPAEKLPVGDVSKDFNAPIVSKKEAEESLRDIDALMIFAGETNLPN